MHSILNFLNILLLFFLFQINIIAQSPYSLETGREIAIFGGGLILAAVDLKIIENTDTISIQELRTLSRNNVNSFDRGATYNWSPQAADWSDILLITSIASPLLLFSSSAVRDDAGTYLTMYLQNILTTYSVSHLPKAMISRYRPYSYNDEIDDEIRSRPGATLSFFSAHTSVSFASAVFLSTTFSKYNPDSNLTPYIWGTTLLIATAVGYLRYTSGQHFPTDIITGAIVGSVIGFLIPLIHESEKEKQLVAPAGNPYNNLISFNIKL
ncbi:MAG: phosphatase PAP2 family protein [Ignavibacteriaceae bacterium]